MEDGESSSQSNHDGHKSIFSYISDGISKVQMARDLAEPFMKSESLDVNRLKRKLDLLKGKKDDVNEELSYAESLSQTRQKKEVETWLKQVEHVEVEAHRAEQEVEESKGTWLPKLKLPEKFDRLTREVEELHRQGDFPGGLTHEPRESQGLTFPTTKLVGQGFEGNKKLILDSLRDGSVFRIGIYGMGGVGKTTLLTHVNNELVQSCRDASVLWVTVSQKFTIHKLQDDIARELEFCFLCREDERKRAAELWNFLGRRKKKWVLILDDVWEDIPLDEVGVRVCTNGSKLVLTTRSLEVCRKMDCQKKIEVKCLSEEESWKLFRNKLGDDVALSPQIKGVAKSLVRECSGLPLGIITMARSMKGVNDLLEWKNALENTKESNLGHGCDDMGTKVFRVLKYSYDMLRDPKVQECFLDCSLYPEDFEIEREELIELFIDEGLIDVTKSRQAKFYRGHTMLNKLVNACLLESVGTRYVKMHDLVRDMALQITSDRPRFLVEAGKGLCSIPDVEVWKEDLVKVSLMRNKISEIPSNFKPPNCPRLSTLLLCSNFHLLSSISEDFFLHMKGLALLDLSHTDIQSPPASIFELVNLSALLLRYCCRLSYVSSLAKLRALKKLDLYGSAVLKVPDGIENLLQLRYLDLRACFTRSDAKMLISGTELVPLRRLENLYCSFRDIDSYSIYARSVQDRGPASYKLHLGEVCLEVAFIPTHYTKIVILSFVTYTTFDSARKPSPDLLFLPKCAERLVIESSTIEVKNLSDFVSFDNATNLMSCSLTNCSGFEYLFSNSSSSTKPHRTIENLELQWVNLLGLIPLPASSHITYCSHKELTLYRCHRMSILFANASLPHLETVTVLECDLLEDITSSTISSIPAVVMLPKLVKLYLNSLPSLESVSVMSDSLQWVKIIRCPKLKRIPLLDRERFSDALQKVCIDKDLIESMDWDNPDAKDFVRSLNKPIVSVASD